MLCSKCGQRIHPVVAIDIDGTLARYHQHFIIFARSYTGTDISLHYNGKTTLAEHCAMTKDEYRQCKLAFRQGGLKRSMPAYDEAERFMYNLNQMAEVWVTTTRPYLRLDNIDPDTRHWLERHGMQYSGLLYDEDKYARLRDIAGERVVAVVEDEVEQYDRAEALGLHPILIRRPHNAAVANGRVGVDQLGAALRMIERRLNKWKDVHVETA